MKSATPSASHPPSPRVFGREFVLLFVGGFLFIFSQQLLIPVLAIYTDSLGGQGWEVGLVVGGFSLAALLSRLPMGRSADRAGRRPLMFIGASIYCAVPLVFMFTDQVWPLVLLRLVQGVGLGAYSTAALAMVADIAPAARRGEVMGLYGVGQFSAVAAGPAVAGFAAAVLGFSSVFLLSSASALGALVAAAFTRGTPRPAAAARPTLRRSLAELVHDDNVKTAAAGVATLALSWGLLVAFLPLQMDAIGLGPGTVGIFFTVLAVTTIAARPLAGRLSDRMDRGMLGLAGLSAAAFAVLLLPFQAEPVGFGLCAVLYGLGHGTCGASFTALSVDTISPVNRGLAVSTYYLGTDAGVTLGSAVLGGLTVAMDFSQLFPVITGLMWAGAIALFVHRLRGRRGRG